MGAEPHQSTEERTPRRVTSARAVLAALAMVAVAAAIATGARAATGSGLFLQRLAVEAVAVAVLLGGIAAVPAARQGWASLPAAHRALGVAIVFCLLVGQFSHNGRKTFPFLAFDMYARGETREPAGIVVTGLTADGRAVPLSPARLYRALSHNRMANFVVSYGNVAYRALEPREPVDEPASADPDPAVDEILPGLPDASDTLGEIGGDFDAIRRIAATVLRAHNRRGDGPAVASVVVERLSYPMRVDDADADVPERTRLAVVTEAQAEELSR